MIKCRQQKYIKINQNFKHPSKKKTTSTTEDNIISNKPFTVLDDGIFLYINKMIQLFNKLPFNIKIIENMLRFKIVINIKQM